nr:MAG TPA: hypothetical protein [Caudoviricetes sp.]
MDYLPGATHMGRLQVGQRRPLLPFGPQSLPC